MHEVYAMQYNVKQTMNNQKLQHYKFNVTYYPSLQRLARVCIYTLQLQLEQLGQAKGQLQTCKSKIGHPFKRFSLYNRAITFKLREFCLSCFVMKIIL